MNENIDSKRWIILIASCLANIFMGITYCWSVFSGGMVKESIELFGTEVAGSTLALAFTINTGIGPIPMILGGWMGRKFGPGKTVSGGAVLILIGMIATSFANNVTMVYLGFGLLVGLGVGAAYGVTINNTVRFFPDKRGLIAGISTFSFGLGSILFPPIIQGVADAQGIMATFRIFGIIGGVVVFIAGLFIKAPPDGWLPKGFNPPPPPPGQKGPVDMNWKQMLADARFWVALIAFVCFSSGGLFIVSNAKQMATNPGLGGLAADAALATMTVTIIGCGNSGGRLIWGAISDKLGRYPTLMLMAAVVAVCGFLLPSSGGNYAMFIALAVLIVMSYGGSMGVYPALTADNFGPKYNGINYGLMFCGFAGGGLVGPMFFTAMMESAGGDYSFPLTIVGVFGCVAFVFEFILWQMRKAAAKKQG